MRKPRFNEPRYRWKLDLTGTSLGVASVILESGVEMVKEWTEEQLNGTQEIIMTGVMVRKEARLDSQVRIIMW